MLSRSPFGLKLAVWHSEMQRNLERFRRARRDLEVGKISGPVGAFSYLSPELEETGMHKAGNWFCSSPPPRRCRRDRHAAYSVRFGDSWGQAMTKWRPRFDICSERRFGKPRNPSARGKKVVPRCPTSAIRSAANRSAVWHASSEPMHVTALENVPLWHERDISHSSAERIILPDSTTLVHYLTIQLNRILKDRGRKRSAA